MIICVYGWICAFLVREGCCCWLAAFFYTTLRFLFSGSKVDVVEGKRKWVEGRMHVLTKQIQRRLSFPSSLYLSPYLALSLPQ